MMLDDMDINLIMSALVLALFAFMVEPALNSSLSLMIVVAYVAHHWQGGHHGTPRNPH
jgi:hypothetical protein